MKEHPFVFADLSTFDVKIAQSFYSKVFQWKYKNSNTDYYLGLYDNKEISGLYPMPQKFQDIRMPSFWMSYIQVNNLEETVNQAKRLGGIIELVDLNNPIGKIALIRDPLGAGFTVYEGNKLNSRFENQKNGLVWNALFVSDVSKVKLFYEGVFNWEIKAASNNRFDIISNKKIISAIHEVSNSIKGKFEYWGVFFAVENIDKAKKEIIKNGGTVIYEDEDFTLCTDSFDAMFHIVQLKNEESKVSGNPLKWKAIFGLLLILLSFSTNWYWIWTIFFVTWVVSDIKSGYTHMFEPISKTESPLLYWIVVMVWALIGLYSMVYYFKPDWFGYY